MVGFSRVAFLVIAGRGCRKLPHQLWTDWYGGHFYSRWFLVLQQASLRFMWREKCSQSSKSTRSLEV